MNNKSIKQKNIDKYIEISESTSVTWMRGILQSLDVEIGPNLGVKLSLGQALERFIFTQADIIAQERIKEAIRDLNIRIKDLEINDKLNEKIEEHAKLLIRFCGAIGSQENTELRNAYISQLANFFDKKYADETNKYYYQQLLFRLSKTHFAILIFSSNYLGTEKGGQYENSKTLRGEIIKYFTKKDIEEELIDGIIKDLDSMGLLNKWQSSAIGGDIHGLTLSNLGRRFLGQLV